MLAHGGLHYWDGARCTTNGTGFKTALLCSVYRNEKILLAGAGSESRPGNPTSPIVWLGHDAGTLHIRRPHVLETSRGYVNRGFWQPGETVKLIRHEVLVEV